MLLNNKRLFFALLALLLSNNSMAQEDGPFLNFKFNRSAIVNTSGLDALGLHSSDFNTFDISPSFRDSGFDRSVSADNVNFSRYDMTLSHPWAAKNVNIGLGLTLRHLSWFKEQSHQATLPLLHASALYDFSLKGLSAGIEGNHAGSIKTHLFDYKAKVVYEWRNGFGMQGGWQHQQYNLDETSAAFRNYERQGPYVDFYLNF